MDGPELKAIERAKREWEDTVDALTAVVCVLDAGGSVLRANRAVEAWGLGSVSGVVGKPVHAVLHPACSEPGCRMAGALAEAREAVRAGRAWEFEIEACPGGPILRFASRPMRPAPAGAPPVDTRIVLVVDDVSELRRAQRELEAANRELESRVQSRTLELSDANRDLRRAELELRESRNDLALLSEQLIQAQEAERGRIALELHDSVGQSLSAIKYTLERAMIMLQRGNLGDPEDVLALAVRRIQETADGIRAISMNLRPPMLDSLGASSATTWFCRGFAEVYPHLTVRTLITAENADIPRKVATHLYRSVQELLNNAAKHARAVTVCVALERRADELILEVRDDGIGLPDDAANPMHLHGAGIRNLRERAEMSGGDFSLQSQAGGGTTARIVWRLEEPGVARVS